MCGCCSRAAIAISRLKRSAESVAATSDESTFTTMCRPSALSVATNTRDIPPRGSSRSRTYWSPSAAWKVESGICSRTSLR